MWFFNTFGNALLIIFLVIFIVGCIGDIVCNEISKKNNN